MSVGCDRLNYPLEVCRVCGQGIKQTQGFTWVRWKEYAGEHENCTKVCGLKCPVCHPQGGNQGLFWVGKGFYTPEKFIEEAKRMGVCKRISHIPKDLKLGEDWVFLAHPEACEKEVENPNSLNGKGKEKVPGIFYVFKPQRVEKIVTETQAKDEDEMEKLRKRGITPITVPDDDPDHRGTVYDKGKKE